MVHSMTHHLKGQRSSELFVGEILKMPTLVLETDKLLVYQQELGQWDNLNHLVVCKLTSHACIVDPFDGEYWYDFCTGQGIHITEIWLTHSHWDHVKGVQELVNVSDQKLIIRCHELEQQRGFEFDGITWWSHPKFTAVKQNFGGLEFTIHCTPGHTPGHVTIAGNGLLITGDCLFLGRCGRTDLYGGSKDQQRQSLLYLSDIISILDGESVVLPGHRYPLADGTNPTVLKLSDFVIANEALNSVGNDEDWNSLDFLAFDDNMAAKARRQEAQNSEDIL